MPSVGLQFCYQFFYLLSQFVLARNDFLQFGIEFFNINHLSLILLLHIRIDADVAIVLLFQSFHFVLVTFFAEGVRVGVVALEHGAESVFVVGNEKCFLLFGGADDVLRERGCHLRV